MSNSFPRCPMFPESDALTTAEDVFSWLKDNHKSKIPQELAVKATQQRSQSASAAEFDRASEVRSVK